MSIRMLFRRCYYCGYRYRYNPSVGYFGQLCPKCGRVQAHMIDLGELEYKEKRNKKEKKS